MSGWTVFFVCVGVGYITALFMRFIAWLDTPRSK